MELKAAEQSADHAAGRDYCYTPADGGFEIAGGKRFFNRPLYSTVDRPDRLIVLAGDRPDFMVMKISATKDMLKLANLRIADPAGRWLSDRDPLWTRHRLGLQSFRVGAGTDSIRLDAVRALGFEGLLLRIRRPAGALGSMTFQLGGRAHANYDRNPDAAAFKAEECRGTSFRFEDRALRLSGEGPDLFAACVAGAGADAHRNGWEPIPPGAGVPALLRTVPLPLVPPRAVLHPSAPSEGGELYVILTTDDPGSPGFRSFLESPRRVFEQAVSDQEGIAASIRILTPDPYADAALSHCLIGYNASWNAPTFRHGAIAWHDAFAGWRVAYGATVAGWHMRAQSHAQSFFAQQETNQGAGHDAGPADGPATEPAAGHDAGPAAFGRIPSMLGRDGIYNMNEVLVDQALYDWEWSGDLDSLRNGGFDAISRHLDWGELNLKTPDGLYENLLNAWNTDYKWCNAGGGTIASAYYLRANRAMADIAGRLGKDPSVFHARAEALAAAIEQRLWSESAGVYGEYRDTLGLARLHGSPDLSSIYTPIDLDVCDPFRAYRMLRFASRRFERPPVGLPRRGEMLYSSEWLPNLWSTRGLYTAEIIHTLLAWYRIGQAEEAEPFRRAVDGSFFAGPTPGSTGCCLEPDGRFTSHTDFCDTSSLYLRLVVEGLFGLRMNASRRSIAIQPSFPMEWPRASIESAFCSYSYAWDGLAEELSLAFPASLGSLAPTVRLRARRSDIVQVLWEGRPADYTIEPGISFAWIVLGLPSCASGAVRIVYGHEALPRLSTPERDPMNGRITLTVDRGRIIGLNQTGTGADVSGIAPDGRTCAVSPPSGSDTRTVFVLVEHADIRAWYPSEIPALGHIAAMAQPPLCPWPSGQTEMVDIRRFCNQRLSGLHSNTYTPQAEAFSWAPQLRTVLPNGRSWWETHQHGKIIPDLSAWEGSSDSFRTDAGIPFIHHAEGPDGAFTSLYDQFPSRIEIPLERRGRRVAVLLAASTNPAQSRIENGRITVRMKDGALRSLALTNPETIDDWLSNGTGVPYVLGGRVQALGSGTHALLHEIDLGGEADIESLALETFSNEVLIGLLGISLLL